MIIKNMLDNWKYMYVFFFILCEKIRFMFMNFYFVCLLVFYIYWVFFLELFDRYLIFLSYIINDYCKMDYMVRIMEIINNI